METKSVNANSNNTDTVQICKQRSQDVNCLADVDDDPRQLIPKLCNHFYNLGWASGTGGGLSIRRDGKIYCAPTSVQKERIKPSEIFVLDEDGRVCEPPQNDKLRVSECLHLFMIAFKLRNAGCCIHSHSIYANLITSFYNQKNLDCFRQRLGLENGAFKLSAYEFRISRQEMIKGINRGSTNETLKYTDTLVVPIIDNVLYERDLVESMRKAVEKYPDANAILVRDHGVYIWGRDWKQAKSQAECYEYLFRLKLEAIKLGFDWMLLD